MKDKKGFRDFHTKNHAVLWFKVWQDGEYVEITTDTGGTTYAWDSAACLEAAHWFAAMAKRLKKGKS